MSGFSYHHERVLFLARTLLLPCYSVPGNRIIKPSFRRKPESRTLGSRPVLFREDFLDSGFRRNDGYLRLLGLPWLKRLALLSANPRRFVD